jgi:hypothetical protein
MSGVRHFFPFIHHREHGGRREIEITGVFLVQKCGKHPCNQTLVGLRHRVITGTKTLAPMKMGIWIVLLAVSSSVELVVI